MQANQRARELLITSPAPADGPPATAAPPPSDQAGAASLLAEILRRTGRDGGVSAGPLDQFLSEPSPWKAICRWLGLSAGDRGLPSKDEVVRRLSRDLASITELVSRQVNTIIHHPDFQRLEASWRGLRYLVDHLPDGDGVKIRLLSISWSELEQDLTRALEFDQSQLFRKIYESEFGMPGGEPFGVLLGDYEIRHRRSVDHPQDDIEMLGQIASVAAASFAPFIAGVHHSFFGLDSFSEMERPLNLPKTFEQVEYLKWRSLRQREDARFVGLTLPRVLMRLPYHEDEPSSSRFRCREDVEGPDRNRYLWSNAVYAFGAILIRCFATSGWLADIRGVRQGADDDGVKRCLDEGGVVTDLPVHSFRTDKAGVATKTSTDVIITDAQEKELGELGFIPLCHCYDTEFSTFYGNQSIQQPKKYDEPKATANARLSAMLQYIFCVSRFSHFLKVISRDKIGSMNGAEECEEYLRKWLRQYTTANDNAGPEVKAKFPLREANVEVRENHDRPGSYSCIIHLRPHFQFDQMVSSLRLTTELSPARPT